MIIVTGAAGFIGSALVGELLRQGWQDIVAVDDFSRADKEPNLAGKTLSAKVDRKDFFTWLDANEKLVQFIFHLGARTDTTEFNTAIFDELNLHYSQRMWEACVKYGIPLVYASSAATYGDGDLGYSDQDDTLPYQLKPLNPYGDSKNDFDKWALAQAEKPYFWAGLKFFNVYGPNEGHKGAMKSVAAQVWPSVRDGQGVQLFRSYREGIPDGGQKRDFVYVRDVAEVVAWLLATPQVNGVFNLGSGQARSFEDLARAVFAAAGQPAQIDYIPMPTAIRDHYQYFTEARMERLAGAGYPGTFTSLEDGVADYVRSYLATDDPYR